MTRRTLLQLSAAPFASSAPLPRMEAIPEPYSQVSFQRDRQEIARFHHGRDLNRPFLYPVIGPAGRTLTRMGHPGDPHTHSHHNSVWISYTDVNGVDFWADQGPHRGRIVVDYVDQLDDSPDRAGVATKGAWTDGDGNRILEETRETWVYPLKDREWLLVIDLQLSSSERAVFAASALGPIGVRVAKWMSVHFGNGRILNSEGLEGEPKVFRKPAKWVDYSGSVQLGVREGLTLFDHPANPNHPSPFHVREDGWMGAMLSTDKPVAVDPGRPLHLRYGLFVHSGSASKADLENQ